MKRTIRLFQNIRKIHYRLGIESLSLIDQKSRFNWKVLLNLLCMTVMFISQALFLFFEANSVMEYGICFSFCLVILASSLFFVINLIQIENISNFIEKSEDFIEMSKFILFSPFSALEIIFFVDFFSNQGAQNSISKIMYTELNARIELTTKWILFYMTKTWVHGFTFVALCVFSSL